MSGSPFDRPQGNGFFPESVFQISSNASALFADGYVVEKRGSMRAMLVSLSGFPVTAAPAIMVVSDGPSGTVFARIPLYGAPTVCVSIIIPVEMVNGIYVAGVAALSGVQAIEATFVHEVRDPAPEDQQFPR